MHDATFAQETLNSSSDAGDGTIDTTFQEAPADATCAPASTATANATPDTRRITAGQQVATPIV
jgi:hypothetical protein